MNAYTTKNHLMPTTARAVKTALSEPLDGTDLSIGSGFTAKSFTAQNMATQMDPLVMVDHYVMTAPTFGAHPHAGMSAVTVLFEDSTGLFHNRDSLGNEFDLRPGDVYWLSAGRGAIHDEYPLMNARTHGLQVFVNVAQHRRFDAPTSLLVRAEDMPVISTSDYSVKVALGESHGVHGAASPATPMTLLVGKLQQGGQFAHTSASDRGIWIQSVDGDLDITVDNTKRRLTSGQALAVATDSQTQITIRGLSHSPTQFALFDGERIDEAYVQEGPFVMGSQQQIEDIKAAYAAGELGSLTGNR